MTDASAIRLARLDELRRELKLAVKRSELARIPRGVVFELELLRTQHRRVGRRNLRDAPLHRREGSRSLRIGEGGRLEQYPVGGETGRAGVSERRPRGNIGVERNGVEARDPSTGADAVTVNPPRRVAAHEHEGLHVLHHGGETTEHTRAVRNEERLVSRRRRCVGPAGVVCCRHVEQPSGKGINQRHDLVGLEKQVARLTHDVAEFLLHFEVLAGVTTRYAGIVEDAVVQDVLTAVPRRAPSIRAVVGQLHHAPEKAVRRAVDRLEVIGTVLVRVRPGVVVADGLGDGEVTIPVRVVGVSQQPVRALQSGQVVLDVEEIGRVRHRRRSLIALLVHAGGKVVDELVKIALGQVVRVEEVHVVFLLRPAQAPEIAGVLVGTRLARAADDTEMKVESGRCRHADLVPQEIIHDLLQREGLGAPVALAFAGGQLAPLGGELFSALVFRIEIFPLVELVADAALAGMVASIRAAQPVGDVVIHGAVVNHRAFPVEEEPAFVLLAVNRLGRDLVGGAEPGGALINIRRASDQRVNGQRLQSRTRKA